MQRVGVTSSNLASVGYEEVTHVLEIEFHSGSVYQYYGVPLAVYRGLLAASSKGEYHHDYIKNSYPFQRVS